jgi:hypothetical protein
LVSDSVIGRGVVIATNDTLLSPEDLAREYIYQKTTENAPPRVRMVVLNSEGISFSDLVRTKILNEKYGVNVAIGKNKRIVRKIIPFR